MRNMYKILSIIGGIMALSKGTYHKRMIRKQAHKATAKGLGKFFK